MTLVQRKRYATKADIASHRTMMEQKVNLALAQRRLMSKSIASADDAPAVVAEHRTEDAYSPPS